jgi:hypothetical protein
MKKVFSNKCEFKNLWFLIIGCFALALVNLSEKKPASQVNNYDGQNKTWIADMGNDGNADATMANNHCFHTGQIMSPWWQVDLQDVYYISRVDITNRKDCCCMYLFFYICYITKILYIVWFIVYY